MQYYEDCHIRYFFLNRWVIINFINDGFSSDIEVERFQTNFYNFINKCESFTSLTVDYEMVSYINMGFIKNKILEFFHIKGSKKMTNFQNVFGLKFSKLIIENFDDLKLIIPLLSMPCLDQINVIGKKCGKNVLKEINEEYRYHHMDKSVMINFF